MQDVEIQTQVLLQKLKENREHHNEVFVSAFEGWQRKFLAAWKKVTEELQNGRPEEVDYGKPYRMNPPVNHEDDYLTAIAMLEAEQRPTVTLSRQEFMQFYQDDWGWKQQWSTTNMAYTSMQ